MSQTDPLFELESNVLALNTDKDAEAVLTLLNKIDWLSSRSREIKKMFEKQLIEWIEQNGDIELGTVRWYVGDKKTDKNRDMRVTVRACFEACHGDFDEFCDMLSSSAIKVGAARKILGDAKFAELFDTVIEKDLKTGKPVKVVHKLDSRFVNSNTGNVPEGTE